MDSVAPAGRKTAKLDTWVILIPAVERPVTNKQINTHFSCLAAVRRQIATKLGMWKEHVRTIFGPSLTFCVRLVVSELGGFENLGEMTHRSFVLTNLSFMSQIDQILIHCVDWLRTYNT